MGGQGNVVAASMGRRWRHTRVRHVCASRRLGAVLRHRRDMPAPERRRASARLPGECDRTSHRPRRRLAASPVAAPGGVLPGRAPRDGCGELRCPAPFPPAGQRSASPGPGIIGGASVTAASYSQHMANHTRHEPAVQPGPAHLYWAAPGQPQPAWTYLGEAVDPPTFLDVPLLRLEACPECGTWPCLPTCPAQDG